MRPGLNNNRGFTLIEVIVTLIVSAILAVLLLQVMSGHITRSYWGLEKMDSGLVLREVMEIINADYRRLLITDEEPLRTLQSNISTGGDEGGYWAAYGTAITDRDNYCLELGKDPAGESDDDQSCDPDDRLLKITLEYDEHSLTTLFSR